MSLSVERNGFVTFQTWVQALVVDLSTAGFDIVNIDGSIDPVVLSDRSTPITQKVLLQATPTIDPVADQQPWSIALIYSEQAQYVDIYVCTPDQIIDSDADFRVARKRVEDSFVQSAGKLTESSYEFLGEGQDTRQEFRFMSFEQWLLPNSDTQANPLSYRMVTSSHGVSLQCWVESYDSDGDKFAWFCVQRMVDNTGQAIVTGRSPLFCLFANRGYADQENGSPDPRSILQFTVRESDINSPTIPVTAVEDTADSTRFLNAAQQVSIKEDNTIVMYYPNDLNTQRHKYPHQLDMLGAISSDVISQSTDLEVDVFGESTSRVYRGMNADREFNRGVRILFWIGGGSL